MANKEKIYPGTRFKENGGASWSYRFQITLDSGETYNEERSGFSTSKQAFEAKNQRIAQIKLENHLEKNITFNQLYKLYVEEYATDRKSYNTNLKYDSIYRNHFAEPLGNLYVNKVQPKKLSQFLKEKEQAYKSQYPINMYNLLMVLFKFAVKYKYVKENIMDRVYVPKCVKEEVVLPTKEQLYALRERLETTNLQLAFVIGMGFGLRASEVYALRWSDFDFENNTVNITKQLQKRYEDENGNKVPGYWCFTDLKTEKSKRKIKFGNELSLFLQSVKSMQKQNRLRYKEFYIKTNKVVNAFKNRPRSIVNVEDFINVKQNGEMLIPDSNKVISRIAKEMGINFNFHLLRHNYMSALAESGVGLSVIRDNVGHANLRTMLETYLHSSNVEKEKAGEIIDTLMNFTQLNESEE